MKINEFQIIFVAGVHGVGKTVFSERLSRALGVPRLSASMLIAEHIKAPAATNKRVKNVEANQDALVAAIESHPINSKQFILDGHFCVFDSSDTVKKVSPEVFKTLAPVVVVLLHDEIQEIHKRLESREAKKFDIELLNRLQKTEIEHANEVCNLLDIPMFQALPSEHEQALCFAGEHLTEGKQ